MKNLVALSLAGVVIGACGKDETREVRVPMKLSEYFALRNPSEAPAPIRSAAGAVARIWHFAGWSGTAFFLEHAGERLLVTNDHVVGKSSCAKEGCHVQILENYEKGQKATPRLLKLTPVARDGEVDVAFFRFQAVNDEGHAEAWNPATYLTLENRTARELIKTRIHVLGHPEGFLKKWSEGSVLRDVEGVALHTAFSTRGNSGSPVLNDAGRVVGILHSGVDSYMSLTQDRLNIEGYESPSALMIPILEERRGLDAYPDTSLPQENVEDFLPRSAAYLASLTHPTFTSGTPFSTALLEACEAGLEKPHASASALAKNTAACQAALDFIACPGEKKSLPEKAMFCPATDGTRDRWQKALTKWADEQDRYPGSSSAFLRLGALASLVGNDKEWISGIRESYAGYLARTSRPLDVERAVALVSFATRPEHYEFQGIDLVSFIRNYRTIEGYWYEMSSIIDGLNILRRRKAFGLDSESNAQPLVDLQKDPHLSVSDRLRLEARLYSAGLLK